MPTEIGNKLPVATPTAPTLGSQQQRLAERRTVQEQGDSKPAVSGEELSKVVADVAQYVRRELNFSLDEESGRTVVKIIDSASNEVVRQIPSEEMLALARHLAQMAEEDSISGEQAKGLFLTARA